MRALVIGRGSMGRRRIRDLTALGVSVASWDITDDAPLPVHPQVVVVSTPPGTHKQYAAPEWPTFTEADIEVVEVPHYPSATPLFCADIKTIERMVRMHDLGYVGAYTLHVGQHLADWHPGADLRTYYAAQRETGACREMIPFELIWLSRVFGPVKCATGKRRRTGSIFAEADDVYQITLEHEDGALGHMLIDALSRPAQRRLTIVGTSFTTSAEIRYTEDAYLAEMRALLDAIEGRAPWPYSQSEEAANLGVLHMIERSA